MREHKESAAVVTRRSLEQGDELPGLRPAILVTREAIGKRVDDDQIGPESLDLHHYSLEKLCCVDDSLPIKFAEHGIFADQVHEPQVGKVSEHNAIVAPNGVKSAVYLLIIIFSRQH